MDKSKEFSNSQVSKKIQLFFAGIESLYNQ